MKVRLNGEVVRNGWARIYRFFGFDVCCPKDVRDAIENCPEGEELIFEINSPGGSVYEGFEMYSAIREYQGATVAEVQSIAASAASVFIAGCDTVRMSPVANVMIHRSSTGAYGDSVVMRQTKQMLDTIDESILTAYLEKANGKTDRETFARMMRNETFMTAQQAVDCGLADEIMTNFEADADPALAVASASGTGIIGTLPPIEDLLKAAAAAGVSADELDAMRKELQGAKIAEQAEENAKIPQKGVQNALNNGQPEPGGVQTSDTLSPFGESVSGNKSTRSEGSMDEIQTKEQLMERFPELTAQIRQEAAAEASAAAAKAERERIAAIDALAMPGYEQIIANAKADPALTAGAVAQEIVLAQKQSGDKYLERMKKDAADAGVNDVPAAAAPEAEDGGDADAEVKDAVEAWKKEGAKN